MFPYIWGTFFALLTPVTALATPTPQEIGSVTVTGDRHSEPIVRSARPTFVVTAAQIRARGAQTIAAALEQTPGVVVLPYGPVGQSVGVLLPGSNKTNDLLVLINGFPVQNPYSGSVDLGILSTAGVDRIEIVQGSASALYGSSAAAGVINIITGESDTRYGSISTGSFGTNRLVLADSLAVGTGRVHAAFGRVSAQNNYPYVGSQGYGSPSNFPAGTRINAYGQLTNGLFTYGDALGKRLRINAIASFNSSHNGVPNGLPTTDFTSSQAASTQLLGVSFEHNGDRAKTTLAVSNTRNTLLFSDPQNGSPTSSTTVNRNDFSLRTLIGKGPSRLLLGGETSLASVDTGSTGLFPTAFGARQSQSALFTQYEHDIASTGRVYAGLRYERDSPQGRTVAPSLGAAIPIGALRLSANAATAYRVPTLIELYYPGYGSPNLQPERSRSADITLAAPQVGGGVSLRVFARRASNLIQSLPVTPFTASNIARASFQGFVLSGATKPMHHLILRASYTDTYLANDVSGPVGTRLLNAPQTITTFALEREPSATAVMYGITGVAYSDSLQFNGRSPAWTALNAYVRVPVSKNALLTMRTANATNEGREANTGYPLPGRSYEVELSTR